MELNNKRIETFEEFLIQIESAYLNDESSPFCPQDLQVFTPLNLHNISDNHPNNIQRRKGNSNGPSSSLPTSSPGKKSSENLHCSRQLCTNFFGLKSTIASPCCSSYSNEELEFGSCLFPFDEDEAQTRSNNNTRSQSMSPQGQFRVPYSSSPTEVATNYRNPISPNQDIVSNSFPLHSTPSPRLTSPGSSDAVYLEMGQQEIKLNLSHYRESNFESHKQDFEDEYEDEDDEDEDNDTNDNPFAPGLFPKMDINDNEQFMTLDSLPLTPAYVSK